MGSNPWVHKEPDMSEELIHSYPADAIGIYVYYVENLPKKLQLIFRDEPYKII